MKRFRGQFEQSRIAVFVRAHWLISLFIALVFTIALLYAPALVSYFISDDFGTVTYLLFTDVLAHGQDLQWFLLQSNDGGLYFRPTGQLFYLVDSLMWGVEPFGYHLTNLIFHVLNSLLVFFLAWRLSTNRAVGLISMALFAVMSVHSEAVAWIGARYDIICAFFYLLSVLFFVLYRRAPSARLYLLSLVAFVLALSSKELSVTLPLVLIAYDLIYGSFRRYQLASLAKRHLAFWLILALAIAARLLVFGRIGYGNMINSGAFFYWLDKLLSKIVNPIAIEGDSTRWVILSLLALVLVVFHARRPVVYGIVWIPLIYITTFNSGASDRSFYIPSIGLALALATIMARPLPRWQPISRLVNVVGMAVLVMAFSIALFVRNQQYQIAGEVAQAIPSQVQASHPVLSQSARLYFIGVPDELQSGVLIYITGLLPSFQLSYRNPDLQVFKVSKFPILDIGFDDTFFFEVDHRRVRERRDLVQMLKERAQCAGTLRPLIEWIFSKDDQGWEVWNDLSPLQVRDGIVMTKSAGTDPYMGSPSIDIPAVDVGDIVLTLSVRSSQSSLKGSIFWLATGQDDFYPGLHESFSVQADGNFHTYRVDIGSSGKLFVGDRIMRLRLDPVDAPAEIELKSVAIFSRCASAR